MADVMTNPVILESVSLVNPLQIPDIVASSIMTLSSFLTVTTAITLMFDPVSLINIIISVICTTINYILL